MLNYSVFGRNATLTLYTTNVKMLTKFFRKTVTKYYIVFKHGSINSTSKRDFQAEKIEMQGILKT